MYAAVPETGCVFIAEKWCVARTQNGPLKSNHGVVIAGATDSTVPLSGGTSGGDFSFVWRGTIDSETATKQKFSISGLDAAKVTGETMVHELAHQWHVNGTYTNHECTLNSYDSTPTLPYYCQGSSPKNTTQFADDHVAFHYVGTSPKTADSEYMSIRREVEPKTTAQ